MFVIGLILIVTNFQIDSALNGTKCTDDSLQNSNKGILIIGVTSVVASLCHMACTYNCNDFKTSQLSNEVFAGVGLLMGIALVVLASVINDRAGKATDCKKAKDRSNLIIVMGSVMIVLSVMYFGYMYHTGKKPTFIKKEG